MKRLRLSAIVLFLAANVFGQKVFTHADTLRGSLSPLRTFYDVNYYDLTVKVDIDKKFIEGSNLIRFKVLEDMDKFQIDLFANMKIKEIDFDSVKLNYTRDSNAVFITLPRTLKRGELDSIRVMYYGNPIEAKHAPWDGGFVWSKDKDGNPWIGVACEGIGASLWWPNKDHLSDKPDSMRIHVIVPKGLTEVSNGRLEKQFDNDSLSQFDWFVSYPINNYNVTLNIAKYDHFSDYYVSGNDSLRLDYYVLPYNRQKAEEQFKQVKPMMKCYEKYLGRYPFWRDGYKLVETPYLGMEHQSAIAYGNDYKTGYMGKDYSGIGLDFDYIIIHETAHEWWGNHVTASDLADMWIHEGFATYTEALYVECMFDSVKAQQYVNAKKGHIKNEAPVISHYGVNEEGDKDMYAKGMLMLNTIRFGINNDSIWWSLIKGIQQDLSAHPISTDDIINYFDQKTGHAFDYVFHQYLRYPDLPVFEYQFEKGKSGKLRLKYRWVANEPPFNLSVRVTIGNDKYDRIYPHTGNFQTLQLDLTDEKDFKIDTNHGYFLTSQVSSLPDH